MSSKFLSIFVCIILLSGCAIPKVVEISMPNDNILSCAEIEDEIKIANQAIIDADEKRGVNALNTAAFLFWLPGLAATYLNVNEAIAAAKSRITLLEKTKIDNNCS